MGLRLVLLAMILALNAFFAAAEVSLVSVRRSRLRARAEQGETGAQVALNLLANPERLLSVSQVGMTLASLGLGWAGEETVFELLAAVMHPVMTEANKPLFHGLSFVIAFLIISFLHIVIGEVIPKNLALSRPDRLAVLLAPPLLVFQKVSAPFVWVVERVSAWLSKGLGISQSGGHGGSTGGHSADELKFIVRSSRSEGHLETFEEDAIQRLLDMQSISAREIMVPRNAIVGVPIEASLDEVMSIMMEHKYSRVPVYEGSIDKVAGVLHYKDLMRAWQEKWLAQKQNRPGRTFRIRRYIRKKLVVPESKPLNQLVDEFRASHTHLAIVVDEHGTVSGVVTLEDVMEQIVGEIADEHDPRLEQTDTQAASIEVDGTIPIRDLATMYLIELPGDAGFETLAGFLLFKLGYIPSKPGAVVMHGGMRFEILEMERNRIARVRIEREAAIPPAAADAGSPNVREST